MRTARQILEEAYADTCTRLKDFDMWCIEEAMKKYAEQECIQFLDDIRDYHCEASKAFEREDRTSKELYDIHVEYKEQK